MLQSNNRRYSLSRLELEDLSDLLYTLDFLKFCCYSRLSWTVVNLTCFPVDTILGIPLGESYSDIRVLVDLFVRVKYTNKHSGTVARETVAELTSNLA